MLTIKVEIDSPSTVSLVEELEYIKEQVAQGFVSGLGWSVVGEDEVEEF